MTMSRGRSDRGGDASAMLLLLQRMFCTGKEPDERGCDEEEDHRESSQDLLEVCESSGGVSKG